MLDQDGTERTRVTLYRCACGHCDLAEEQLRKLCLAHDALFEVQRVDSEYRMRGFAGWKTPIVTVDGVGITHYKIDAKAWEDAIKKRVGSRPSELTGMVVDMRCFFERGARPSGHQACARRCFAAGGPIGIATIDGRVYLALPDPAASSAYERLKEAPEEEVRVTGEIRFRDGISGIVVGGVRMA